MTPCNWRIIGQLATGCYNDAMKSTRIVFHPLILQLIRFGATGGLATATHFIAVIAIVELSPIPPIEANVIGYCLGFIVSFIGHRHWTFSESTRDLITTLPRFFAIALINFVVNLGLFYLLVRLVHMPYVIALIIVLSVVATISFVLSKHWAFRQ